MRNLIVCTILVLASSQVWGELSIEALEPQPFDSRIVELFELGQGQLLLQTRGLRELKQASQSTSFEYRDTIYIRGADGRTKARVDLPDGLYPFIVPYGHGFAVQQLEKMPADGVRASDDVDAFARAREVVPIEQHAAERGDEAVRGLARVLRRLIALRLDATERRDARAHDVHRVRARGQRFERLDNNLW